VYQIYKDKSAEITLSIYLAI